MSASLIDASAKGIARNAVACTGIAVASGLPKWRQCWGMVFGQPIEGAIQGCAMVDAAGMLHTGTLGGEWLPDFRHHATLGCLRQLVRDAWGPGVTIAEVDGPSRNQSININASTGRLRLCMGSVRHKDTALSRAQLYVSALYAAPTRKQGGS